MDKLLMVEERRTLDTRTLTTKVVNAEEIRNENWDFVNVPTASYFRSTDDGGYVRAFDPNVVDCPTCGGEGGVFYHDGPPEACSTCGGEGVINLSTHSPGEFDKREIKTVSDEINRLVRLYGPHVLTPANYLYWLSGFASKAITPQTLESAYEHERQGKRDEAMATVLGGFTNDYIEDAVCFVKAWERAVPRREAGTVGS